MKFLRHNLTWSFGGSLPGGRSGRNPEGRRAISRSGSRTLADIYTDIAMIAGVVGASNRAAQVISDMQDAIEDVRRRAIGLCRKRVFCEEWANRLLPRRVGGRTGRRGRRRVYGDPGKQVPASLCWNASRGHHRCLVWSRRPGPSGENHSRSEWAGTSAARTSQIYCISDELLNTPAPTLIQGLRALASAIHPEAICSVPGLRSITTGRPQKMLPRNG